MAKKKSETDPTTEQVVDVTSFAEKLETPAFVDDVTSAPEVVEPETPLFIEGEDMQMVSLALPKAVLYALLDPSFEGADNKRASALGLLDFRDLSLTPLGERVVAGTDVTALRHKIATAWRLKHNAELDAQRSKVERA